MADGSVLAAGGLPTAPIVKMMGGGGVPDTVLGGQINGFETVPIAKMTGGAKVQVFGQELEIRDQPAAPFTGAEIDALTLWNFRPDRTPGALSEDEQKAAFLVALVAGCNSDTAIETEAKCQPLRESLTRLAASILKSLSDGSELTGNGKFRYDVNGHLIIEFTTLPAPPPAITTSVSAAGGCPTGSLCIQEEPFIRDAAFINVVSTVVESPNPVADVSANIADFSGVFLKDASGAMPFGQMASNIYADMSANPVNLNDMNFFLFSKLMEIEASGLDATVKEVIRSQFAKFIRLFNNGFIANANTEIDSAVGYILNDVPTAPDPLAAPPVASAAAAAGVAPVTAPLPKMFSAVTPAMRADLDTDIGIYKRDTLVNPLATPEENAATIHNMLYTNLSNPAIQWDLSTDSKIYEFRRLLNPAAIPSGIVTPAPPGALGGPGGAGGPPPGGSGAAPPPGGSGAAPPPGGSGAAPPPGGSGAAPPPGGSGAAPPPGAAPTLSDIDVARTAATEARTLATEARTAANASKTAADAAEAANTEAQSILGTIPAGDARRADAETAARSAATAFQDAQDAHSAAVNAAETAERNATEAETAATATATAAATDPAQAQLQRTYAEDGRTRARQNWTESQAQLTEANTARDGAQVALAEIQAIVRGPGNSSESLLVRRGNENDDANNSGASLLGAQSTGSYQPPQVPGVDSYYEILVPINLHKLLVPIWDVWLPH